MAQIKGKCHLACHKECYQIQYSTTIKDTKKQLKKFDWYHGGKYFVENYVKSNAEEPMFKYTEEPVLTFTEYLVYCGGLMGLWFGASAHDIIVLILNSNVWKIILKILKITDN